jgi:site-specific recombinase XerD
MSATTQSIYLYLRKSRPDIEGRLPIYIRIKLNYAIMEYPTGQTISAGHWDARKQKATKAKDANNINGVLTNIKADINQAISNLQISRTEVTLDNLRKLLKGEAVTEQHTLIKVSQEHNDNFQKQIGKKYSAGSYKNYKTTLKYLIDFVPEYSGKKDIPLKAVNYKFCEAYFTYLTTKKKCHVNGANKQIQRLKKIINYSIQLGYIQSSPMANYTIEFMPVHRVPLTMEEIKKLAALDLNRQVLKDVRDVFLMQCYTGLSYGDIKQLTANHIQAGDNGKNWIRMKRQKTSVSFAVPLLPMAMSVLGRYLAISTPESPLMPVISNQKMNNNLKLLQELAGISKNLTTHLARHSFATTITLSNGVPIETVSKMLGHTKLSTTQIYAKVLDAKIDMDMQLLSDKLQATLNK